MNFFGERLDDAAMQKAHIFVEVNASEYIHITYLFRAQSFTSLKAELRQDINRCFIWYIFLKEVLR